MFRSSISVVKIEPSEELPLLNLAQTVDRVDSMSDAQPDDYIKYLDGLKNKLGLSTGIEKRKETSVTTKKSSTTIERSTITAVENEVMTTLRDRYLEARDSHEAIVRIRESLVIDLEKVERFVEREKDLYYQSWVDMYKNKK